MAVLPPDPVYVLRSTEMGAVHCICFHNHFLFAGTAKGTIHLWDLQSNRSALHFKVGGASSSAGKPQPVQAVAHFAETLVTQDKYSYIQQWSMTNSGYVSGRAVEMNNSSYCRMDVDLAKDLVAVPKKDSGVAVFNAQSLEEQRTLEDATGDEGHPLGSVMALKLIQIYDRDHLLGAYESGMVCLWDLATGKLCHRTSLLPATDAVPTSIDYDPESNRGLIGSSSDKIVVFSIDRRAMQLMLKTDITVKNAGVNRVRIRSDKKVFGTAGWDGRVRLFSWKSLRPLAVLTEHKRNVLDMAYSPQVVDLWKAPVMATAGEDGFIALWDLYN